VSTAPQQPQSALATASAQGTSGITLAHARQVSVALGPQNLEQAWALAQALAGSDLVPEQYRGKPANIIAALFMANDLGIGVTHAMREIYVVEGRPTASAALKVSLILQSGVCELWEVTDSTDNSCTIRTKRRGKKETSLTLTMEQVKAAGFADSPKNGGLKDTWKKFPRIMLRHRVESWLGDQEYPDVVRGLRTPDETGETVDEAPPRVVSVPAQTTAVIPVPAAPNPDALPPLPKAEPHDPVTGEVVDAPATPPAPPATSLDAQVEQLAARIAAAKTSAEVDELRAEVDKLTPKENEALKSKRNTLGRAINAARTALQVR
jgi:hypothetical protein